MFAPILISLLSLSLSLDEFKTGQNHFISYLFFKNNPVYNCVWSQGLVAVFVFGLTGKFLQTL